MPPQAAPPLPLTKEQQTLVEANLGLARSVAHYFARETAVPYDDLFQLACLGLTRAVRRWDENLGYTFSTNAMPFIRGEVTHWLRDKKEDTIATPRGQDRVRVASLDVSVGEGHSTLQDLIADDPSETDLSAEQERIREAIAQLDSAEQQLLILKYFNFLQGVEIAEWLEISAITASRRLARAEASLHGQITNPPGKRIQTVKPSNLPNALPYRDDTGLHLPAFKTSCVYCGLVFGRWKVPTPSKAPRYCSQRCGTSERHQHSLASRTWSPKEMALLESLVGKFPRSLIVKHYQGIATAQQLPKRSKNAIVVKLNRAFTSVEPTEDRWTMPGLARQLGIEPARVKRWAKRGLSYYKVDWGHTGKSVITKAGVQEFARSRPDLLAGIDVEKLVRILDDRQLAEQCSSMPVKVLRREVQRLDTKKVYPSITAAKRSLGVYYKAIQSEIRRPDGWLKESAVILAGSDRPR